ncbi:MAG: TIGR02757 family protein [Bacteroidales bacterium]|nr:TIGR02757 family protein [Bacteroidales bacterium]MBD5205729.1 TIGR02757 family protein [Bacteroidales bacterium]
MNLSETGSLLLEEAHRINRPEFIKDDPVQFPRRFEDLRDIEITSLLVASISWGKRSMILRDAERMLNLMDNQPYRYMMERGYEDLDDNLNVHRTFFARNLKWYLRGLRSIYEHYDSLDSFISRNRIGEDEAPAWLLASTMGKIVTDSNNGETCSQCIPTNLHTTALKRINMALRWMVRDDGIVDMGVWKSIPKEKLFIPLDVHVGNTARGLGITERRANDRKCCEIITSAMKEICPHDPTLLDFALFGIGVNGKKLHE